MITDTALEIVNVKPIQFDVFVRAGAGQQVDEWIANLKHRHSYIKHIGTKWGFTEDREKTRIITSIQISLEEDADYQQLCRLRAELKKD